jgi:hypothetical protein
MINSILSLINNERVIDNNFSKNPEDTKLINEFLSWKNEEKDKFVYNTVSYGYIYCTLTVKKNDLLANKLFKGKKFILDANIIFRLAGIDIVNEFGNLFGALGIFWAIIVVAASFINENTRISSGIQLIFDRY